MAVVFSEHRPPHLPDPRHERPPPPVLRGPAASGAAALTPGFPSTRPAPRCHQAGRLVSFVYTEPPTMAFQRDRSLLSKSAAEGAVLLDEALAVKSRLEEEETRTVATARRTCRAGG